MAGDRRTPTAAVDDEVVALGFSADRFIDGGIEKIVGFRGAQRFAQVGGVLLTEAHIERAGAGHSYAIARFTEIMRERSDEPEAAAGLRNVHVARRPAGPIIDVVEPVALGKPRAHERQRQILIEPPFANFALETCLR